MRPQEFIPAPLPSAASSKLKGEIRELPLEQLKAVSGPVMVPRYVPQGYVLARTVLREGRQAQLVYEGPAGDLPHGQRARLVVERFDGAHVKVLSGFSKEVPIRGLPGLMVQGAWAVKKDGNTEVTGWMPYAEARVLFEDGGSVSSVACIPGDALDERTLLDVASPLEPAQVCRSEETRQAMPRIPQWSKLSGLAAGLVLLVGFAAISCSTDPVEGAQALVADGGTSRMQSRAAPSGSTPPALPPVRRFASPPEIPLAEAYRLLAASGKPLYVPTYLPDGVTCPTARVHEGGATVFCRGNGLLVDIIHVRAANLLSAKAHGEVLLVGGEKAYLVRGGWVQVIQDPRYPSESSVKWDSDFSLLSLYVEMGDAGILVVEVRPVGNAVDDAALVRIAESTRPYEGE